MKPTLLIIFMSLTVSLFCQTKNSGLWILKEKPERDTIFFGELHPDLWDTAFAPITNDSILSRYTYLRIPDAIKFEKNEFLLIYGDLMDPNSHLMVKSRNLYTHEGDCIFAWEPTTSMYEYVITWNG